MKLNLVKLSQDNKQPITTSRTIAQTFGKQHKNIIRSIEAIENYEDFNRLNFEPVEYLDKKGELRREYEITKDGAMFLIMGFTGRKATDLKVSYIREFNRMADLLNQRQELTRQLNDFSIRDAISVQKGSYHGRGLNERKKEKRQLKIELLELNGKHQLLLEF